MGWAKRVALAGAVSAFGVAAARIYRTGVARPLSSYGVLVDVGEDRLRADDGGLIAPLAELSERAEVSVRANPHGRGTLVWARAANPGVDVRRPLRELKQELETGEVLRVQPWPAARGGRRQQVTELMDRALAKGGWR